MGNSFYHGIYSNDPLAKGVGLTDPMGKTDSQWIPKPAYSGITPSLSLANSGYGTLGLKNGQMATYTPQQYAQAAQGFSTTAAGGGTVRGASQPQAVM